MPSPEFAGLTDRAVLWAVSGVGRDGEPRFTDPVEIPCRLNGRGKADSRDAQGNVIRFDADVKVSPMLTVKAQSLLWLGRLADLPGTAGAPPGIGEILAVVLARETKDAKGRVSARVLKCNRWKSDRRPT